MTVQNLPPDGHYLIALSGGADSVALALMMKELELQCRALHCNFHLRGEESDRDEQFVRDFCHERDIPLEVKHFDTLASAKEHGVSIEMEARQLRYAWFAERAEQLRATGICVAHHLDDQAETLLLNLIRGTGLQGLAAMHPDRTIQGLRILRPLLGITKEEILQYLLQRKQPYVTDSTNLERDALRNKIRLDVIPLLRTLNPNISQCLARTADNVRMALDEESEESRYHQWLAPLGFTRSQILDIYAHRPTQPNSSALPLRSSKNQTTNSTHTGKMWHSSTHTVLMDRGKFILRERTSENNKALPTLVAEPLSCGERPTFKDFQNKQQGFVDADCIQGELRLRHIQPSDRFRPYGMTHGTKLVSDYLTDRKVNLLDKQSTLVAYDTATGAIVWLVGHEIDHRYRITEGTTRILRLHH